MVAGERPEGLDRVLKSPVPDDGEQLGHLESDGDR